MSSLRAFAGKLDASMQTGDCASLTVAKTIISRFLVQLCIPVGNQCHTSNRQQPPAAICILFVEYTLFCHGVH